MTVIVAVGMAAAIATMATMTTMTTVLARVAVR
jgi:hypothetical protein